MSLLLMLLLSKVLFYIFINKYFNKESFAINQFNCADKSRYLNNYQLYTDNSGIGNIFM